MAAWIAHCESDFFAVTRDRVALHGVARQYLLDFFPDQVFDPQFVTRGLTVCHSVIKLISIRRERGGHRISLRGNLVVPILVVEPNRAVSRSNGRNE